MSALPKTGFACMGGFCRVRTSCRHYHAEDRSDPAERLCSSGLHDVWQPVSVVPDLPRVQFDATQIGGAA